MVYFIADIKKKVLKNVNVVIRRAALFYNLHTHIYIYIYVIYMYIYLYIESIHTYANEYTVVNNIMSDFKHLQS